MFYIAEAFLLGEGLSFSTHGAVIAKFGEFFSKTKRVPHQGDYNAPSGLTEANAVEQIEIAQKFLELAEQMLGQLP